MQQFGCLRAADAISLQHIQVLFAVKPLLVLHADEWQAPTGICLTDSALPAERERDFGAERQRAAAVMFLTCCPTSAPALQPPSKAAGRVRQMQPCRKQISLPPSRPSGPSRDAEIHLDSRWLQTAGLQTPPCNLAGGSLYTGVRLAELPRQALHPHREAASHPGTDIFLPEGHSGCFRTAAGAA